jgi:hypothetical protein
MRPRGWKDSEAMRRLSHLRISRKTLVSPIRCSTNRIIQVRPSNSQGRQCLMSQDLFGRS